MLSLDPSDSPEETMTKVNDGSQLISKVYFIGIFIIWLISLITTVIDSKNNVEPNIVKWTRSGIVGATITSVLSFALLLSTMLTSFIMSNNQAIYSSSGSSDEYLQDSYSYSHNFNEFVYLGGFPSDVYNLPEPPKGEGVLRGKVTYLGDPAIDVTMDIVLNSKYRVEGAVTDENGVFTVDLPPGEWIINAIQTNGWKNKPKDGEFAIYYGGEKKLSGSNYDRHGYLKNAGYSVIVGTEPDVIHFNALISNDVKLVWPNPAKEGIDATINDSISWQAYPDAKKYYVEINKIRREGDTTTHYESVTSRVLSNETTLPLSSLKHIKTERNENSEYSVQVYAFSEDGTLIAEFSDVYNGGTFIMPEGVVLVEDGVDDYLNMSSVDNSDEYANNYEAISLNKRRKEAVSVLIDDNLLSEAELLVNIMESKYSRGNKEVLSGYILALKGECDKANEMFDQASSINPNICISDEYKGRCKN